MKTKNIYWSFILLFTFFLGACNSDNDEPQSQTPDYLTEGTESRPTWTTTDRSFEFYMTIQTQLGDTLVNFQSDQDLMCATINGEVRAATGPKTTGDVPYFPLTIGSDNASGTVTLQYYCDRLHRIYTITNWATFDPSTTPTGEDGIYRPKFTEN